MKSRTLGPNGPQVFALGLGCIGLTHAYTTNRPDESSGVDLIHRAFGLRVTLLDAVDIYGPETNEQLESVDNQV